ncbi:MAG: hypothetical protein ACQESK_08135 [Bacteroidota bacterium]
MGFFKYKWQVFLIIALCFGMAILVNSLIFKFLELFEIILAYAIGFIFAAILLYLRRKEAWFKSLK